MSERTNRASLNAARSLLSAAAPVILLTMTGCATTPEAPPAPAITAEQKMAWILQLEDQRILRVPPAAPAVPDANPRQRRQAAAAAAPSPDLTALVRDEAPRIRRRAALAIGRVKLAEGVEPLVKTLADADPDVRAMAAFGLGLIGDASAEPGLLPLLQDPAPMVRGRAAEALGSIGAKSAAAAIGTMAAEYARSAPVASMQPDDESWPAAPEAEAFKLGLFALVRLGAYEPLAAAVLHGPRAVSSWWPVAYALQRIGDTRAAPALLELLKTTGRYTPAFAARGLGELREPSAAPALLARLQPSAGAAPEVVTQAVRALARIGEAGAVDPLVALLADPKTTSNLRLEVVNALGTLRAASALPIVQDLLTDPWPAMRSAALHAAAAIDPQSIVFVLASLEPDPDWRVRAALASVLAELPAEIAVNRLRVMLKDEDKRVRPSVLGALVELQAPDVAAILLEQLQDPDFVVRAAAAGHLGKLKPAGAAEALRQAYKAALPDSAYEARAAALTALAEFGAPEAAETLQAALADKDWAVRVRAAELLNRMNPGNGTAADIRPVPGAPPVPYDDPQLVAPDISPRAYIETAHGTIEFEFAVLDAPQTSRSFMALAAKGFFTGLAVHRVVPNFVVQDGDPRGDGHGGPGYTIRDELNDRPYLRGTVGMALDWADTGGSQFFITHSPQPHLDGRYTVFGRVVNGMDVVDRIRVGDVIQRVRVWDGSGWK
jgi:HEAT repeat protein/cyclophilin family peptidyl-prolyl cis-trans isomerase